MNEENKEENKEEHIYYKQTKYMKNRFGLFKTCALLCLYRITLKNTIHEYTVNNMYMNKADKIENIKKVYNYLYNNQDIFNTILYPDFVELTKEKLFEFYRLNPEHFAPILKKFGWM